MKSFSLHSEPHSILDPQPTEEELREMQRRFLEQQVNMKELECQRCKPMLRHYLKKE